LIPTRGAKKREIKSYFFAMDRAVTMTPRMGTVLSCVKSGASLRRTFSDSISMR